MKNEETDHDQGGTSLTEGDAVSVSVHTGQLPHADWRSWCCFMFTDNSPLTQALSDDRLRHLIALNIDTREGRWQPIESLPFTDATPFLAWDARSHAVYALKRRDGRFWIKGQLFQGDVDITHWMPLPAGPSVGNASVTRNS